MRRDQSHGPGARSGSDRDVKDYDVRYSGNGDGRKSTGSKRHRGRKKEPMNFDRDIQSMRSTGEEESLRVMRTTIKDLIKSFRDLERPFLKPEFRQQDSAHWSTAYPPEKSPYPSQFQNYPLSEDESPAAQHMHSTNRLGHEYITSGFKERWLWVRRKATVTSLNQVLSRIEVRRMAHEVGEVLSVSCDIGRDMEDMRITLEEVEGRLNRVVGIRRVD